MSHAFVALHTAVLLLLLSRSAPGRVDGFHKSWKSLFYRGEVGAGGVS